MSLFSPPYLSPLPIIHHITSPPLLLNSLKEDLADDFLEEASLLVMGGPQEPFDHVELSALRKFLSRGGNILLLSAADETNNEGAPISSLNAFLEDYGISFRKDAVVRTSFHKDFLHPKEARVNNASTSPTLLNLCGKKNQEHLLGENGLSIVYPYGTTLSVQKPAIPLLSSGDLCFPANQSIGAYCNMHGGKIIALGSAQVFHDDYINQLDNTSLLHAIVRILTEDDRDITPVDDDAPEYGEPVEIPDMEALAERVRSCLQDGEEISSDFTRLFDQKMFNYDTSLIPQAVKLYEKLEVKHDPLTLIPPQFEVPHPPLQPAVFMPTMRDLPPPVLELYDLDQHFASDKIQLSQLTNKCSDKDLDYYVKESGQILGVSQELPAKEQGAKNILEFIFKKLVEYKKMEQDSEQEEQQNSFEESNERERERIIPGGPL